VYAEPFALAATQLAFSPRTAAQPIAAQPIASVRPLIVTTRPPAVQRGGGFGRFLIGLSLVSSIAVSLYRNGVVRDAAHSLHQEALFARLESALGGPSFGTLASLEPVSPLKSDLNASQPADAPAPREAARQPIETAAQAPVVSLESLKPEHTSATRPKVETAATAAAPNPAFAASPKPAAQPKLPAAQRPNTAATAKPAAPEKPAPASKPASAMNERERLNAAIGQSMLAPTPKSKSKSKASEYDPLNPKL
jgi:hypothetical protein